MGFMGKIKQWMGIGGVKVQIHPSSPDLSMDGGLITGTIELNSKTDQHITKLTATVLEHWSTGRGNEKRHKEFELGTILVGADIPIKAGETKTVDFSVPYVISKSLNDRLAGRGGVVGALGKLGKMADAEKSVFEVRAHANVKGTAIGSTGKSPLRVA